MKLSRNQIKLIAIITMFCDHATKLLVSRKTEMYRIGRKVVGRMAFPLFGALLVEGFVHTRRKERHLLLLIGLTLLSEPLHDYVLHNGWIDWSKQSILVTWSLCYLMMYLFHRIHDLKLSLPTEYLIEVILTALFGWGAYQIHTDYSYVAVIGSALSYNVYKIDGIDSFGPIVSAVIFALLDGMFFTSWWALLALIPMMFYRYTRSTGKFQSILYWAYPIHLIILGVIFTFTVK